MAIEIEADVQMKVDVIPADGRPYGRLPVLESADRIGAVAAFGGVVTGRSFRPREAGHRAHCTAFAKAHGGV